MSTTHATRENKTLIQFYLGYMETIQIMAHLIRTLKCSSSCLKPVIRITACFLPCLLRFLGNNCYSNILKQNEAYRYRKYWKSNTSPAHFSLTATWTKSVVFSSASPKLDNNRTCRYPVGLGLNQARLVNKPSLLNKRPAPKRKEKGYRAECKGMEWCTGR